MIVCGIPDWYLIGCLAFLAFVAVGFAVFWFVTLWRDRR